ncbi:helix-turn-helix domain-containing protein [Paenibacillus rhizoplanae]
MAQNVNQVVTVDTLFHLIWGDEESGGYADGGCPHQ